MMLTQQDRNTCCNPIVPHWGYHTVVGVDRVPRSSRHWVHLLALSSNLGVVWRFQSIEILKQYVDSDNKYSTGTHAKTFPQPVVFPSAHQRCCPCLLKTPSGTPQQLRTSLRKRRQIAWTRTALRYPRSSAACEKRKSSVHCPPCAKYYKSW